VRERISVWGNFDVNITDKEFVLEVQVTVQNPNEIGLVIKRKV
jgi:hypothetical protein